MNEEIQRQIIRYYDFIEDKAYIEEFLSSHKMIDIVETLLTILSEKNEINIIKSLLFCRDISLLKVFPEEALISFRKILPGTTFFKIIEKLVYHENFFVREEAVYTLGKISFKQKDEILERAFNHYLKIDPILLPRILFELFWLNEMNWQLIRKLVCHENYLFRWSVLDLLESYSFGDNSVKNDFSEAKGILEQLSHDSNPFVKKEADYCMAEFLGMFPSEKPAHTFFSVSQIFRKYLYEKTEGRFKLFELEQFILNLTDNSLKDES